MGFTVKTTAAAEAQGEGILAWLSENADATRFAADVDSALRTLARSPWRGPPSTREPGLRRLLLRRADEPGDAGLDAAPR